MENSELAFKALAIAHTIAGYIFFGFASVEEFQESCFYRNRNRLVGDILKFLSFSGCWSLIACGVLAFFLPKAAVAAVWASVAFFLLTGLPDLIAERRWPSFCKTCAVSLGVRIIAATALSSLTLS
jgi:hypothetical protein